MFANCRITVQLQVGVAHQTAVDWLTFVRDLCSAELLHQPRPIGGQGHTVAIDDILIFPDNVHRHAVPQWMFGGVDLATKEFFMQLVPSRDWVVLEPIIQTHILPGTTIWSDHWGAYVGLHVLPQQYIHQTVNHDQMYVDPVTGYPTVDIKSRWNACKMSLKKRCRVARHRLLEYLDDYMWRCQRHFNVIFRDILQAIRRQYPV